MSLLSYQRKALEWVKHRPVAFLALEQGLGKTIISSCDIIPPCVVVCPASMKLTWREELSIWRPELKVQVLASRDHVVQDRDVWIVNYDILARFTFPPFVTFVADESQYAKSYTAKRTKAVVTLIKQAKRSRFLSGTPAPNRPVELWPLLYATKTTRLDLFQFGMKFCAGWKTPWDTYDFSGFSNEDAFYAMLDPVMLRLTKAQVLKELPPKTYRVIELDLPVDKREKDFSIADIERSEHSVSFQALSDVLKMNAQRKLPLAVQHIRDILDSTSKVVVFAHHREIVDELMKQLNEFNPVRVVGGDTSEDRFNAVKSFQNDPKCRVFVGNIRAAGVGLTLTAASRVVFVESSWSPADIEQAADRCHRIGQRDHVLVDILTISKSVDAQVLHGVIKKLRILNKALKETTMADTASTIFNRISELHAELADQYRLLADAEPAQAAEKPAKADKPAKAEKPAAAAALDVAEAAGALGSDKPKAEKAKKITVDDVRELVAKLIANDKRDKAVEIMGKYGATRVSGIPEDKLEEAHGLLKEAA